jgi:acetolactate synthase I/II/III large subunit
MTSYLEESVEQERPGAAALVQQLVREGAGVVFGIPGIHLMGILDSLHGYQGQIRYITARHEQATAFMADGYARVSGRPGVSLVVPGPGVYNAGTGLATAYAASSPVLQIAGQVARAAIGRGMSVPHEVHDQLDIVRPVTKSAERVTSADDLPRAIHEAFAAMRSGRPRPAHLEAPPEAFSDLTTAALLEPATRTEPELDPAQLAAAVDVVTGAKRPIVIAGGGVHAADASAALTELAGFLQAGIITTREGKGAVDERSALSLGTLFVHQRLRPAIADADVIIAVGTRLQGVGVQPHHKLVHIDIDASEIGRYGHVTAAVVADAGTALRAMLSGLRDRRDPADDRAGELRAIRASVDEQHAAVGLQASLVRALRRGVPQDAIVAVDATQVGYMCHMAFPVYQPRSYLTSSYMGTLGFAFTMALGAKVAAPHRPVLSVSGDGGFLFNSNELATAVQYGLNTVSVVFNDSAYGNTRLDQVTGYGGRVIGTTLRNPDLVAYAESFGAAGVRAKSAEDLTGALREAFTDDRPVVIEMPLGQLGSAF